MSDAIYIIESGPMLEAVKQHIADKRRVGEETRALALSLGAVQVFKDCTDGRLVGVTFAQDAHHSDFKKAAGKHGRCFPKKGTISHAQFAEQKGYPSPVKTISQACGVPLSLSYTSPAGSGWTRVGHMLAECGFLYFGPNGPYALWIPDVAAEIAAMEAKGYTVEETFDMVLPGCRRILEEEWDVMVAQHNLAEKKASLT